MTNFEKLLGMNVAANDFQGAMDCIKNYNFEAVKEEKLYGYEKEAIYSDVLIYACKEKKSIEIVKMLVYNKADVSLDNFKAIQWAMFNGQEDVAFFLIDTFKQFLLSDLNFLEWYNKEKGKITDNIRNYFENIIKKQKVEQLEEFEDEAEKLTQAIISNMYEETREMLAKGAVLNAETFGGSILLLGRSITIEMMELLITYGLDVNIGNGVIFKKAGIHGRLDFIKMLVKNGAKIIEHPDNDLGLGLGPLYPKEINEYITNEVRKQKLQRFEE